MIQGLTPVPLTLGVFLEAKPEMPLPNDGGMITGLLEVRSHGRALLLDQGGPISVLYPALEPAAPAVSARQDGIARRRANGGRGMGVGEGHPLLGQPVQVRSGDFRFRVEGLDVAIAHVVSQDKDDVGTVIGMGRQEKAQQQKGCDFHGRKE